MNSVAQMRGLPQRQVTTLAGLLFEYTVSGAGRPTIVLLAGSGGPIESWFRVMAPLDTLGTVFAYNRPGIGRSEKPTVPETGLRIVETLRALLLHAGLGPPYVLVGHSLGGLYANLFARKYHDETAGVVMLEAAAPEDVVFMAERKSAVQRLVQRAAQAIAPPDDCNETAHTLETVRQIEAVGPFPAVPLVVVSGGRSALSWLTPEDVLAARAANQRKLVALSPCGKHTIAERSGHFPQFTEPHLVIEAVREVVNAI